MDTKYILEFHIILNKIATFSKTQQAKERILTLDLYKDKLELQDNLKKTGEAMSIHNILGHLPLQSLESNDSILKKSEMEGILSIEEIRKIYILLKNTQTLKKYFSNYEKTFYYLRDEIEGLNGDDYLISEIERCITSDMMIDDHATNELYHIRKSILNITARIRKTMESYLNKNKDALSLDNLIIRNDRLVLAVKTSHKGDFQGIVHAGSASGSTLYIEPQQSVLLNNELNELKNAEFEEIQKILKFLSLEIKKRSVLLRYDQKLITELDYYFSLAAFGNAYHSCIPEISNRKELILKEARHPLLDQKKAVSNDIVLTKKMMMITGSNTGGKTVTLKTAGLLSYMALSGIPVPSVSASVYFYDCIYADIGDGQSIEESLSTYSSHMKNMIYFLSHASASSLILIDEIGSGTDPVEGASLASAVLDVLLARGCSVIASTHYGTLKNYGKAREDVILASVGFDLETMKPTYKLSLNSIGSSYAFEIANTLGLDNDIIEQAYLYKKSSLNAAEKLLEKLEKQKEELDQKQKALENELSKQKELRVLYQQKVDKLEKQKENIMKQAQDHANKLVEKTKHEAELIIDELKKQKEIKDHHLTNAKRSLDSLFIEDKKEMPPQTHILKPGDHIKVNAMNREGDIIEVLKNHKILVGIGGLSLKLKDNEVTFLHEKQKVNKSVTINKRTIKKESYYEINVIGKRYDEAMEIVDKFLDNALVEGYPSVRIIHGMGTGALRNGIRKMLDKNKMIKNYCDGGPNEGGLGATLVYFE